jgi:hypothetical protein
MKKSILIIVILSIAALCFAGPLQEMHKRVIAGSTVASGGGPDVWYGPTVSSSSYESSATLCENITILQGGDVTYLSARITDKGAANIKLALYNSSGSSLLSSGGSISNASIVDDSYNDLSISPVSVDTNDIVKVCLLMSGEIGYSKENYAGDDGRYASGISYANFPEATISDNDADAHIGLRIYVD